MASPKRVSCLFSAPSSLFKLISSSRVRLRISRERFGSDTARERLIAPSIALIMRMARARRSEVPFGGTRPVEYAKVRLNRAVYTAFADRLARDMSPTRGRAEPPNYPRLAGMHRGQFADSRPQCRHILR